MRFTDLFQCLYCLAVPAPAYSSSLVFANFLRSFPTRPAIILRGVGESFYSLPCPLSSPSSSSSSPAGRSGGSAGTAAWLFRALAVAAAVTRNKAPLPMSVFADADVHRTQPSTQAKNSSSTPKSTHNVCGVGLLLLVLPTRAIPCALRRRGCHLGPDRCVNQLLCHTH